MLFNNPTKERNEYATFASGIFFEQDWAVVDAEGEEVISQPAAVADESKAFYPPRFIQGYFSLSLRDPSPGDYKIRIGARDKVGEQEASSEARFVLRP